MTTETLLIELGTEELPPKSLKKLATAFYDGIKSQLDANNLAYSDIANYASKIGCSKFIVLIEIGNKNSLKYHERLKFKENAKIKFFKIFGIKFLFFKNNKYNLSIKVHISAPKNYHII